MACAAIGWLALALCAVPVSASAAPAQYSQGDPSDSAQYLLLQLNRARLHPAAEGLRLVAYLNANPGIVSQYSVNVSQVATDFAALPAVPPLAFNADLLSAALSHSADLAAHGGVGPGGKTISDDGNPGAGGIPIGHLGYEGSTPDSRVYASGFRAADGSDGYAGENVAPGALSLDCVHAGYLVDWGNPDLGHRIQSMDGSNAVNVVGMGVAPIAGGSTLVETEDYGTPSYTETSSGLVNADVPAILTGVVYTDKNGNGQYDPGEGVAGVSVSMDAGAYYAVTTASGGFSLPLVNADGSNADGTLVVRTSALTGETAGRTAVVTITRFANQFGSYRANVEWEVVPGQPTAGVVAGPALSSFVNGAAALGDDWYYLAFASGESFGYFNVSHYPYTFHDDLGWEYLLDANDGEAGVYLYDFASASWWYTSPGFGFPYLYDFTRRAVLYYYPASGQPGHGSSGPRYFYDFASGKIITL